MANKRKYLVESTKKMKKIEKNISYDDKLVKIIKDGKSNLDKILEEQGIKKTNSFKNELEGIKNKNNSSKINNLFVDKNKSSFKTPTQTNPNTNLFGNNQNEAKNKSNLFGNQMNNNNNTNVNKSNLFGNPNQQSQKNIQQQKSNLFGNPNQQSKTSNLFGNPTNNTKNQQKANNLFGNPNPKPNQTNNNNNNNNNNQNVNVSLKFDPKSNQIKDVNIQANMDYDTAKKLYEQNKQYLPSQQQMLSGAKAAYKFGNKYAEEEKKKGNDPLSNLFGKK